MSRPVRWSLHLVVLVALLVAGASAASGAVGDRSLVGPKKLTQKPFRGVVLVAVGSRVVCTGFVVAARKVVTAAHCLTRDPANGDYRFRRGVPGNVRLYRAYSGAHGGRTYPTCGVAAAWAHPRFIKSGAGDRRAGSRAHDYAVLTTPRDCTYPRNARLKVWSTTLDSRKLRSGDRIKLAGYPSDPRFDGMNGLNLWRSVGALRPNGGEPAMLYFRGFVARGMSGGPVWRTFRAGSPCGSRFCVVGIATECSVNAEGLCRLGDSVRRAVRITPEVRRAIRNR